VISAGCLPVTLGRVWTGITHTPPALLAQALSDPEDDNPAFRIRAMPDQDSRETTETLVPETDREAPTNPEAAPRPAMPPPAGLSPYAQKPDWWEGSFFQSVFNDVQDARRAHDQVLASQEQILAAIQSADRNSNRNYELIRDEIRRLKDSDIKQDQRLKEGDQRFDQIERSIADLKTDLIALVTREMRAAATKIEALETELAKARTDAARSAPQTPST
jgi:hypothetical protein